VEVITEDKVVPFWVTVYLKIFIHQKW